MTNDIFFDYGDINLFEEKVMKRVMPYYTFFSRNLNYQLNSVFDQTTGMSKALKLQSNLGVTPDENQKEQIPDWLLKYNPKVLTSDDQEKLRLVYSPNFAIRDAFSMIGSDEDEIRAKINPVIKSAIEIINNKDQFLDNTLTTEGYYKNKKPLFSQAVIPRLLGANIEQSPTGGLYTKDSLTAIGMNLKQSLLPTPLLDNLAGLAHDIVTGRKKESDAIISSFSPVKIKEIDRSQNAKQKLFKKKQELMDRRQNIIDKVLEKRAKARRLK
jgi:hypothetical protein